MIEPPPFPQEERRLASLKSTKLLDTPIEERFERITRMVCRSLDVPIALFNLIDEDRQHYKSVQGLGNTNAPLQAAFCTHALQENDMLLVPDAAKDIRFHDNPFVTGEYLNIGFYAGCPVHTPDGMPIGTLCAIDTKPREMTPDQLAGLRDLAAMVETELRVASLSQAQASLIGEKADADRLALIDPLTRLWNREGITNLLEKEWSDSARKGKSVTLVMADIDHLKKINEAHGQPAGDETLKSVARKLLESLRAEDAVGRIGGEEFLIILTDCQPRKVIGTVERIRRNISGWRWILGGARRPVTMSFGVASAEPGGMVNAAWLMMEADKALYAAKEQGPDRVEVAG